jgi:malic enzyme
LRDAVKWHDMSQESIGEQALELHKKLVGKIEVRSKMPVKSMADLSLIYTPGVGAVSTYLAEHKNQMRGYTIKRNTVAVISDGSAVLGLGNIGPEGALPVMEGKAVLFKELAGIDAFPIVLATQDTEEIIQTIKNRRYQPGGYICAALLRHRGTSAGNVGYPGHARRPAWHGGRGLSRTDKCF